MNAPQAQAQIPGHVPAELVVRDFPLCLGEVTTENPFKTIIPRIHEGPEVLYATTVYPGRQAGWVFRRAEDVKAIYRDTDHFASKAFAPFARLIGDSWVQIPAETDPPLHARYRALLNPLFAPKKLQAMEENVRNFARTYIDLFKARGKCEFMSEFAFRFPIAVFLQLMDLPLEEVDQFLAWEQDLLHNPDMAKVAASVRNVKAYLLGVINDRRRNPGDDFISYGVGAEIEGRKLTEDELIGLTFGLYIGGLDTVSTNMALHFRHLAEMPEHQERLRANPAQIPMALEELLRAYAAVTTFRTCVKETVVRGVQILPGDKVAMNTSLANNDPLEFPHPSRVDLDRKATNITFAYGPHRCIGSHLARRELQIALEEFLSAVPAFHIEPGATIVSSLGGIIQPHTLPLVWKA